MKMSHNRMNQDRMNLNRTKHNPWTAGNALSWALGVTLGLIVGIALLIAIPRMMFTPSVSGDSTQPPTSVAQTGDSSGAATTTEQPGGTDETGMASGQTSGDQTSGSQASGSQANSGQMSSDQMSSEQTSEGTAQSTDSETASSTAEQTGGAVQGAGNGENPTQRSSGAAPTPGNMPKDDSSQGSSDQGAAGAGESTGSGRPEAGQQFFVGNCAGCHGAQAQGGVGPALNEAATWSDAEFTTTLREGRTPERELSPVMPRFTEAQISAQQVLDVHAYIKSLY